MTPDARLGLVAASCLGALIALAAFVTRVPLSGLDSAANALRGRGTRSAVVFTRMGYWPALVAVSGALIVLAVGLGWWPTFALVLPAMQLIAQGCIDRIKRVVGRIRPDDWLYHQELGFSFPSGHSCTAVVFYGGLIVYAWNVPLPLAARVALSLACGAFLIGIPWSRLVLAAHYGTDVAGGMLFGAAWLCLTLALVQHLPPIPILR